MPFGSPEGFDMKWVLENSARILAETLIRAEAESGLSQRAFAHRMGLSEPTLLLLQQKKLTMAPSTYIKVWERVCAFEPVIKDKWSRYARNRKRESLLLGDNGNIADGCDSCGDRELASAEAAGDSIQKSDNPRLSAGETDDTGE